MIEQTQELEMMEIEAVSGGDGDDTWPGIGLWDSWRDWWTDRQTPRSV